MGWAINLGKAYDMIVTLVNYKLLCFDSLESDSLNNFIKSKGYPALKSKGYPSYPALNYPGWLKIIKIIN